jgi:hypothetical protein
LQAWPFLFVVLILRCHSNVTCSSTLLRVEVDSITR